MQLKLKSSEHNAEEREQWSERKQENRKVIVHRAPVRVFQSDGVRIGFI